ncbi:hypothetical protein FTO68_01555 [Methanocalculus taiwanensis]|uniref:Uncharacterized protein n=1 Tax=Methanocalculus taiwanensis TaxID=106207 RepID=A0ABD4TIU0_9EURY|nr:hypothetical protein [Methanocalculus taiwanensis]MCQ1537678.1 hypothetical protein [Methanocalculus taiwanensis]
MKKRYVQLIAIISGILLIILSGAGHQAIVSLPVAAVLSIILAPVFLISVGLLFSAEITDGDIPFMGY